MEKIIKFWTIGMKEKSLPFIVLLVYSVTIMGVMSINIQIEYNRNANTHRCRDQYQNQEFQNSNIRVGNFYDQQLVRKEGRQVKTFNYFPCQSPSKFESPNEKDQAIQLRSVLHCNTTNNLISILLNFHSVKKENKYT